MKEKKFKQTEIGMIPEDWDIKRASDCIEIIGGGTPKTSVPEYWNGDIPWISVVDFVGDQRWIHNTEKHITQKGLNESSTKLLNKGQIIISARGTVGELGQVTKDMAFNQSCYGIDGKKEFNNDFLYYILKYKVKDILSKTHGSVFSTITRQTFEQILLSHPPIAEQKAIAKILSDLDAKIELLQQQNKTLEEIGQALFKHWFVDFEFPNEQGKPYKSSGGEMVESELGEIPKGWGVKKFKDIVENFDSKRVPLSARERDKRKEVYPYYGATSVMDYIDDYLFDGIYVLMGEDGSVIKDDGTPFLQYVWGKFWVNNHAHILRGKNGFSSELVYILLSLTNVREIVTGAVQPKISQTNMNSIDVIIPDEEYLKKVNELLNTIFSKYRNNLEEIDVLTKTRDSLLPKLMTGKIRVPVEVKT